MKECSTFTGEFATPEISDLTGGLSVPIIFSQPPMEYRAVSITENGTQEIVPNDGYEGITSVGITTNVQPLLEEVNVEIEPGSHVITPSEGYYGISKATVTVVDPDKDWQPDPTWWDIETIVQAPENQEYPYKLIQLLTNSEVTTDLKNATAYKTSDGQFYDSSPQTHTWDVTQDKPCVINGKTRYKTRWLITYYSDPKMYGFAANSSCLYCILDGITPVGGTVFNGCRQLQSFKLLNGAGFTNMSKLPRLFYNCSSLTYIPWFDTSNATECGHMFAGCKSLRKIPLLEMGNVTQANNMFDGCSELEDVPLFNTAQVTNMTSMFSACYALKSVPDFDTGMVESMSNMFSTCYALQHIPNLNTRNVTSMDQLVKNCYSLVSVDLTVNQSGPDFNNSPLSRESLLGLIDRLPQADTVKILMLGVTNLAKLTDDEKAAATAKNWTLT